MLAINTYLTEKYLWKDNITLLAVYDGGNNLIMRFNYADDRLPVSMSYGGATYYLMYDQVGTLRAVANTSGNIIKQVDYDSFGNIINDSNPSLGIPFGFAGGLHDRDTGLVRFGYRDYDAGVGRWTAKDPIGFKGGDVNLYGYVLSDPLYWFDPWGLHSLVADNGTLTYYDDSGSSLGSYPYTSGDGITDPSEPGGSIPPGHYTLDPNQISAGGFLRKLLGDWGKYRVPLEPDPNNNMCGRHDFFLHGGKSPGSGGCLDIGDEDRFLFPKLRDHRGRIHVYVK